MARRFDNILVEIAKLRNYCLDETHPRGRHKARVFRSQLGLTANDAEFLRQALLDWAWAHENELQERSLDSYGQRYVLDVPMTTAAGAATVRSAWIVIAGERVLRLTSCYVL